MATVLDKRTDVIVVQFNSWLASDSKQTISILFETVLDEIRHRFFLLKMPHAVKDYLRLVSMPKLPFDLAALFRESSLNETVSQIKKLFENLPFRVVVLLDELDRLDNADFALILRMIRGIPNIPNLTFVCAFNKEHVMQQIDKNLIFAGDYLDKFIPTQLPLPKIDHDFLENIFDQNISIIIKKHNLFAGPKDRSAIDEQLSSLWACFFRHVLDSIRTMGEMFRGLDSALTMIKEKVEFGDLLILETIRTTTPEVYDFVYRNGPYFYDAQNSFRTWREIMHRNDNDDGKELYEKIFDPFFESLPADRKSVSLDLLSELFPVVRSYRRQTKTIFGLKGNDAMRRISHPDYFYRYFIYGIPLTIYGEQEIRLLAETMNASQDASIAKEIFKKEVTRLSNASVKRLDFWQRVPSFIVQLNNVQIIASVEAISEISSQLTDSFATGERSKALLAVYKAASKFSHEPLGSEILVKAIRLASSDEFAAKIWNYLKNKPGELIENQENIDIESLKRAFIERMHLKYSKPAMPDFNSMSVYSFFYWLELAPNDANLLSDYWREVFQKDPILVDRYIELLFQPGSFYSDADFLHKAKNLFPEAELEALLKIREATGELTTATKTAFQRFRSEEPGMNIS